MQTLKLTPVAAAIMNTSGSMPGDIFHEAEYDIEILLLRIALRSFHQACRELFHTHGVELSQYYVSEYSGYKGAYLN